VGESVRDDPFAIHPVPEGDVAPPSPGEPMLAMAKSRRMGADRIAGEHLMAHERIEINPKIMVGKPVIRGTRIPVELLLRKLGEGASEADLLDAYPHLSREDIRAAITYAANALAHEDTVPVGPSGG
jgi:uncharacterized protein (DUF433 family)